MDGCLCVRAWLRVHTRVWVYVSACVRVCARQKKIMFERGKSVHTLAQESKSTYTGDTGEGEGGVTRTTG